MKHEPNGRTLVPTPGYVCKDHASGTHHASLQTGVSWPARMRTRQGKRQCWCRQEPAPVLALQGDLQAACSCSMLWGHTSTQQHHHSAAASLCSTSDADGMLCR